MPQVQFTEDFTFYKNSVPFTREAGDFDDGDLAVEHIKTGRPVTITIPDPDGSVYPQDIPGWPFVQEIPTADAEPVTEPELTDPVEPEFPEGTPPDVED